MRGPHASNTFQARAWYPERMSFDERVRHVSYHIEHYIRRMPSHMGGKRRVQRCCIILDMHGFRAQTLPQVSPHVRWLASPPAESDCISGMRAGELMAHPAPRTGEGVH